MDGRISHTCSRIHAFAHTKKNEQLPQTYSGLKSRVQGRERERRGGKKKEGRRKERTAGLLFRINNQDQVRGGHPRGLQRH